jgi:chromosome transmission fidelity protein 18
MIKENLARQARYKAGNPHMSEDYIFEDKENTSVSTENALPAIPVKRDFFGRVIQSEVRPLSETDGNSAGKNTASNKPLGKAETKVWVTFHEGMNNAVRKPITLDELLRGL